MRPSAIGGQTAQEVSYLDEIDDDNVLNALRHLKKRTSRTQPVAEEESSAFREEKKDVEDDDHEEEAFWKDIHVPPENLDVRVDETEVEDERLPALEALLDIFSCGSLGACDHMMARADEIQARLKKSQAQRTRAYKAAHKANKAKGDTKVVHNHMQSLSFRNRKLAKGPIEDDDDNIPPPPEEWITEDQREQLEKYRLQELAPMLELTQKANAFLFQGRYDILELRSLAHMLDRMEARLERRLATLGGNSDDSACVPPSTEEEPAADIRSLAAKIQKIYNLSQEFSETLFFRKMKELGEDPSVAWSNWEEEGSLDDTLTLRSSLKVPNKGTGEATLLPAISSFINLQDNMGCGDTPNQIEIAGEKGDGSSMTYDFSAMDRDIEDYVQTLRTQIPPSSLPIIVEVTEQAETHQKIKPVDDTENRGIEIALGKSWSTGRSGAKPPLPNTNYESSARRKFSVSKLSNAFRSRSGRSSRSLKSGSSRSLNSRSSHSQKSASKRSLGSKNSGSKLSSGSPKSSSASSTTAAKNVGTHKEEQRTAPTESNEQTERNIKPRENEIPQTHTETKGNPGQGGPRSGGSNGREEDSRKETVKWTSAEGEPPSGQIVNNSSASPNPTSNSPPLDDSSQVSGLSQGFPSTFVVPHSSDDNWSLLSAGSD